MGDREREHYARRSPCLLALALLQTAILAACSAAATPPATILESPAPSSPSPTAALAASPSPTQLVGAVGKPLSIPGSGTITVVSATQWYSSTMHPAPGWQYVAVEVKIVARTGKVDLAKGSLRVIDQSGAKYSALAKGMSPVLSLPCSVAKGKTATGRLTFEVPNGVGYAVVVTSGSSAIGSVPLTAIAAVVPTPTAHKTAAPAPTRSVSVQSGGTSGGNGSGSSGWNEQAYQTAVAYQASVVETYSIEVPNDVLQLQLMEAGAPMGMTPEELTALMSDARRWLDAGEATLNSHVVWMQAHPAATCFAAAYRADKRVADAYLGWFKAWIPRDPQLTSEGRWQALQLENVKSSADNFLSSFNAYFTNCR